MAKNEMNPIQPIEHWRTQLGTDQAIYTGVLIQECWRAGREVTLAEYKAAVAKFLTGRSKINA